VKTSWKTHARVAAWTRGSGQIANQAAENSLVRLITTVELPVGVMASIVGGAEVCDKA
jgi:hypothetical protein